MRLLILRLGSLALSLDVLGLFAVIASVDVMGLAPIARGIQDSGGASTTLAPTTGILDNIGFT